MAASKRQTPPEVEDQGRQPRLLHPQVWTEWTVSLVRQALIEHELGEFQASAMLAEHMMRDDRVFATLDQRVLGCLGLPYCLDVSDTTTNRQQAERLASRIRVWWPLALPESTLADLLRWSILMGFAIGELAWSTDAGEWRPASLRIHHPQFATYDHSAGRFSVLTDRGREVVTPGDGRWVLFSPLGASRPWMQGAVRALAVPWLGRTFVRRDWFRRSEIDGVGVRKAFVPRAGVTAKQVDDYLRQVQRLGTETTLKLIRGKDQSDSFDFDLVTTDLNASTGFSQLVGHCDTAITLAILGQNLTTEVEKGGSYAAAGVHARVLMDRLEADVAMLGATCRQQILVPWGRYNIDGFDVDATPWPRWDTTPPDDVQKRATALASLAQALPNMIAAGIDLGPVLERFGLERDNSVAPTAAPPPSTSMSSQVDQDDTSEPDEDDEDTAPAE